MMQSVLLYWYGYRCEEDWWVWILGLGFAVRVWLILLAVVWVAGSCHNAMAFAALPIPYIVFL